jgi:hypothetical protein
LKKKYNIPESEVFEEVKKLNKRRKKLYDNEYMNYVYSKFNIQESELLLELKNTFETYKKFLESIK